MTFEKEEQRLSILLKFAFNSYKSLHLKGLEANRCDVITAH